MNNELKEHTEVILSNSINFHSQCNVIDNIKEGSFKKIKLPKEARYIKKLTFYINAGNKLTEPYFLFVDMYSEGFHEDRTTYFYDIKPDYKQKYDKIEIPMHVVLYSQNVFYQAEKFYPNERVDLSFYVQASRKGIENLQLSFEVEWGYYE